MTSGIHSLHSLPSRNRGVALFISLVLLLILTIAGVSAVQTTTLETRMARNEHDTLLAFQAAESALRDGEAFVETLVSTAGFSPAGSNGLWTVADLGDPDPWDDPSNWTGGTSRAADSNVGEVVAEQPRYLVEHVATVVQEENAYQMGDPYAGTASDNVEIFRITARGVGGTGRSVVLLQSTYGRILN